MCLFYISYCELFRLFALEVFEIELDGFHVFLHVARRDDLLRTSDELSLIVDAVEQDGYSSLEGNEIESLLPVGVERSCAFWSDAEYKVLALGGLLCQVVGHAGVLAAPYGDAAHVAEDRTEGPEEPFLLHQEVALHAFGVGIELPQQKIPVASVWSQADNVFLRVSHCNFFGPPQVFVQYPLADIL